MMSKISEIESYTGGDQGFLNSYFPNVKYAKMLDPNAKAEESGVQRLSAFYNYDVGVYYLNSRLFGRPLIVHYTLGPIKPWIWW